MPKRRKKRSRRKSPKVRYKYRYRTRKRRNPARRRPAAREAVGKLQTLIPQTIAVAGGLLGVRMAVLRFFPTQTGYIRAAIMAGGGLVLGEVGKMFLKGKNRKFATYLQMGGILAAVLEAFEQATGGAYRGLYTLGEYGPGPRALPRPEAKRYFLPESSAAVRSMGDYGARGSSSGWNTNWG